MADDYVIYWWEAVILPDGVHREHLREPTMAVRRGVQAMLDEVIALTKKDLKFSVYKVGECVGDFS